MGCSPSKTAAAAKVEEPSATNLLQTTQGGAEVKPAAPAAPFAPVEPAAPAAPVELAAPEGPVGPAAPAETTEPANAQVVEAGLVKAEEQKTDAEMVKETAELKLETAEVKQETAVEATKQDEPEIKLQEPQQEELKELIQLTITEVKPEERPVQSYWMSFCAAN